MKICINGNYRDMTEEDIIQAERIPMPEYKERVIARIRTVYSVDDELAILRQKDKKPEEFAAYNAVAERIKAEEKEREATAKESEE